MAIEKGKRAEPLFLSQADARTIIQDYCVEAWDDPLSTQQVDLLISALRAQFWISAKDGEGEIGATRLGGTPDLPRQMSWPIRAAMPEYAKLAADDRLPNRWIARQAGEAVPFEFVAQIDLGEAGQYPHHGQGLPRTGRLLFFVDVALLMHRPQGNRDACLVLYDATATSELERLSIPLQFSAMEAWWRGVDPEPVDGTADAAARHDGPTGDATAELRKPFVYPGRAMQLVPIFALPDEHAIEVGQDAQLSALVEDDAAGGHYRLLIANDVGPFTADPDDRRVTQPWVLREARYNRFLGTPQPMQDDPRFDAISREERYPYPWDDARTVAMAAKADEFQLLLQISVADLSQEQTEGMFYFLVRKDALAKADFSDCCVTYQQT